MGKQLRSGHTVFFSQRERFGKKCTENDKAFKSTYRSVSLTLSNDLTQSCYVQHHGFLCFMCFKTVVFSSERVVCFQERPCSAYSLGVLSVKTPADHVQDTSAKQVDITSRESPRFCGSFWPCSVAGDGVWQATLRQASVRREVVATAFTCIWFARRTPATFTQAAQASLSVSISPQTNIEQKATGQAGQKARMLTSHPLSVRFRRFDTGAYWSHSHRLFFFHAVSGNTEMH